MFLRIDRLQTELPAPKKADPNAAAALQELLGGKYGEMSTLGNYFSPSDYHEIEAIWGGGESALPGELVVLDGPPTGGKIHDLTGTASAFAPDYAPEEMFEIANKLYKKAKNSTLH